MSRSGSGDKGDALDLSTPWARSPTGQLRRNRHARSRVRLPGCSAAPRILLTVGEVGYRFSAGANRRLIYGRPQPLRAVRAGLAFALVKGGWPCAKPPLHAKYSSGARKPRQGGLQVINPSMLQGSILMDFRQRGGRLLSRPVCTDECLFISNRRGGLRTCRLFEEVA